MCDVHVRAGRTPFPRRFAEQSLRARSPLSRGTIIFCAVPKEEIGNTAAAFSRGQLLFFCAVPKKRLRTQQRPFQGDSYFRVALLLQAGFCRAVNSGCFRRFKNLNSQREHRRELRRNMTPAEAFLWRILKNRGLHGKLFRRQYGLGAFIFDFYCPEEKLAIELDGHDHFFDAGRQNDVRKIAFAAKSGIRVVYFENHEVFLENGAFVSERIVSFFRNPDGARGRQK